MKSNLVKFLFAASVLLNLTVFATVGYVHYRQSSDGVSPFGVKVDQGGFLFEHLSLQPEQMKIMREDALVFRKNIAGERDRIVAKRKKLITLLRADTQDTQEVEAVLNDIGSIQKDVQRMVVQHILATKAVLDKQQQNRLFDLIEGTMEKEGRAECLWPQRN
jgi:Spy/CpxP family protein refolding chaperone